MKVIDQLHRIVEISQPCKRIVSLVPSQTELLVDLGLEKEIVGITKFCIHPKGLKKKKAIVGGTKNFNFEAIEKLNPDLIIANKEENYKEGIEILAQKYPVWISDIITIEDSKKMMLSIGEITNTTKKAKELVTHIDQLLSSVQSQNNPPLKTLYFIWNNPYMVAGKDNYINEMLELNGYKNLCNLEEYSRYPEISEEELIRLNPEVILLSSEPFPFKEKHKERIQQIVPSTLIKIVDGELYSWYGSRILKALTHFNSQH